MIPVYNEQDNLPLLNQAIREALKAYPKPWEVIYVDDGSRDDSRKVLEEMVIGDEVVEQEAAGRLGRIGGKRPGAGALASPTAKGRD